MEFDLNIGFIKLTVSCEDDLCKFILDYFTDCQINDNNSCYHYTVRCVQKSLKRDDFYIESGNIKIVKKGILTKKP